MTYITFSLFGRVNYKVETSVCSRNKRHLGLLNIQQLLCMPFLCIASSAKCWMKTSCQSIILFHHSHMFLHRFLGGDACRYCYTTKLKWSSTLLRSLLKAQMSVQFCGLEYSGTSIQGTPLVP